MKNWNHLFSFRYFALACIGIIFTACKKRRFGQLAQNGRIAQSTLSLNLNDVSVLYPNAGIPSYGKSRSIKTLEERILNFNQDPNQNRVAESLSILEKKGFWPKLVRSTDNPDGLLSEEDFQDILDAAPSKNNAIANPKVKENFSIIEAVKRLFIKPPRKDKYPTGPFWQVSLFSNKWNNDQERPANALDIVSYDMTEARRWRIVSMRFDPCPFGHTSAESLSGSEIEKPLSMAQLSTKLCYPEMKFVAQPMMGETGAESFAGSSLPDSDDRVRDVTNMVFKTTKGFGTPDAAKPQLRATSLVFSSQNAALELSTDKFSVILKDGFNSSLSGPLMALLCASTKYRLSC